jgi:FkbM family methyltransferase
MGISRDEGAFQMVAVFRGDREQELTGKFLPQHGFFVEVGAYEPVDSSQTFHLEQRGWDGLLIEPVPAQAAKLKSDRRAKVICAACGSPKQHGTTLPLYCNGQLTSLIHKGGPPISVPVITLDSALDEAKATGVDFLSIDVEGAEVDVLQGFSFSKYRPRLILLEDPGENFARHKFMRAQKYKRVRSTARNSWYVPQELDFTLSPFEHFELFRRFYLSVPIRKFKKVKRHFMNGTPQ